MDYAGRGYGLSSAAVTAAGLFVRDIDRKKRSFAPYPG